MKTTLIAILSVLAFALSATAQSKLDVYFDFNKEFPNATSEELLQKWIQQNPGAEVIEISGYTDSVDENNYNRELSMRRIRSVLALLEKNAIRISKHLVINPIGESFEQSPDQSANRKVVIKYIDVPDENASDSVVTDSIVEDIASLFENAKKGDLIRLNTIHFYRNKEQIVPSSESVLIQLYEVMAANPKLSIEIHGHICCNSNPNDTRLSYRRAKFIFTFLLDRGIPLNRLAYKGFGSARPVYPIPEQSAAEQLANRRVEILIVRK